MRPKTQQPMPPVPLQDPAWDRLLPYGILRRVPREGVLYRQGEKAEGCYYVHRGRVKASILRPDGTEKILEVLGPGALLGEAATFDGQPHYSSCIALDPAEVYFFTTAVLVERMQQDAVVVQHILRVLARKQRVLARQVEDMAFLSTAGRVARLMSRLAEEYGLPRADGRFISLYLTHEQIASMVGASRVGVTRALRALRNDGVLETVSGGFLLRDATGLEAAGRSRE